MLDEVSDEIIHYYSVQGNSVSKIAKIYSCNPSVIRRILVQHGIEIRKNDFYSAKSFDKDFFKRIDSEEKAYLLGFIYADGCVSNNTFSIKLSIKDLDLLVKIKEILSSSHKIVTHENKSGYGIGNISCCLAINNSELAEDLISLGVFRNKSKTLKFPTENQVPKSLINHFIRGYFDGDGSVHGSIKYPCISIFGTQDFLSGVMESFKEIIPTKSSIYKYKNKDIYYISLGGHNQILKIYQYFYKEASIFLGRKKDRFEEILNI